MIAVFLILVTLFPWGRKGGEVASHEVSAVTWPPPSVGYAQQIAAHDVSHAEC